MRKEQEEFLKIMPKGEVLERIKKPFLIYVLCAVADVLSGSVRQLRQRSYLHSVIHYLNEPTDANKECVKVLHDVDERYCAKPRTASVIAGYAENGKIGDTVYYAVNAIVNEQLRSETQNRDTLVVNSKCIKIDIEVEMPTTEEIVRQSAYGIFNKKLLKLIKENE